MFASMLTYPHEVLRTRLQMQPRIVGSVASTPSASPANGGLEGKISQESGKRSMHTQSERGAGQFSRRRKLASHVHHRQISGMGNIAGQSGSRYTGVFQACATIAKEEGLRGFYKGMGVNLIRTVPSSALTILTYEIMMQHLTNTDHEQEELNDHKDER